MLISIGENIGMSDDLFKRLLRSPESETLDFKSEQYKVNKIGNIEKKYLEREQSKFMKDIISMANTKRKSSAYIIVGIKEEEGKNIPVENEIESIDDNVFQSLIAGKVNPPPKFLYYDYHFEGKKYGVFEIPPKQNSLPSKVTNIKDGKFGVVEKNQLYIRRGSVNTIATIEEEKQIIKKPQSSRKETWIQTALIATLILGGFAWLYKLLFPKFFQANKERKEILKRQKRIEIQNYIIIILLAIIAIGVAYVIFFK